MPFYKCTICQEDGSPVAKDVTVVMEQVEHDGANEWYGTITGTHQASLAAGQKYRLALDDGRTGDFLVRRNTPAGGVNRAVAIRGMGPLK